MIREAIKKIVDKQELSYDEAYTVMSEIMDGMTTQTQNAAFLAALSTKSTKAETIDEIFGCAAAMRDRATPVEHPYDALEIVGTGGDRSGSFNISTTASIVLAAGGVKVAKHGNRAATSGSGAADCLEALGINIEQSPDDCVRLLERVGICFIFAQKYHTSMKYVGAIRRELGIRTVFNILGPLTNPAKPTYQLLGVYDESLVEPLAKVLDRLGVKRALVVYNREGLDELATCGDNVVCELKGGFCRTTVLSPEELGLTRCQKSDLSGGTPAENAEITRAVLRGESGPRRDTVLLNAGAGFYIAGRAASIADGIALAAEIIDSGRAAAKLEQYRAAAGAV